MRRARGSLTRVRDRERNVPGNERLTALTGVVLLVLSVAEVLTVPTIRDPLSLQVHLVAGVAMGGPVLLKIFSTGYRFFRYYSGSVAYVAKGPPRLLPRILSPLLIVVTVALIATGVGLAMVPPDQPGPLRPLHHASFVLWLLLLAIHLAFYLKTGTGLVGADWRRHEPLRVRGRGARTTANVAALAAGGAAAVLFYPAFSAWLR